jgi:hypothetical protein
VYKRRKIHSLSGGREIQPQGFVRERSMSRIYVARIATAKGFFLAFAGWCATRG